MLKKILRVILYGFYLVIILVSVNYIFYFLYMKEICRELPGLSMLPQINNISTLAMSRLGHAGTRQKSSFVNFDERKKDGVIRVGCFGDSFTHGHHVDSESDYPNLLQNIFYAHNQKNIEVINFGVCWYGFSQAFIMWKYVGKKYNLDYILLGPTCFRPRRDTRFNHTHNRRPGFLHARYILNKGHAELIDVIGDTYKERIKHYYRFIPHIQYLKYDRNAPLFLRCLIPRGKQIKNPFYYYSGSEEKEMKEIYKILLTEMVESGTKIVLFDNRDAFVDLGRQINKNTLRSVKIYMPQGCPHITGVDGHLCPIGNQLVAQQMYDYLNNKMLIKRK